MNIQYFKEFVILAETKNYLEAAEILFISQSSLSKHIKTMENELGVTLFDRTSRSVKLTKTGELMLPYAANIMNTQLEYTEMIKNELDVSRGKVSIGSIPEIAQYGITDLLLNFKKQFPHYSVKIFEYENQRLLDCLRQKQCDLIFMRDDSFQTLEDDLVKIPYRDDIMVALLPSSHPLAQAESLRLEQLKDDPFILLEEDILLYNLWMRSCNHVGFKPRVSFSCHRLDGILDLVTKGMGISLAMRHQVMRPADSGFPANPPWAIVPVVPPIHAPVYLCYRKTRPLSKAARNFVDCVTKYTASHADFTPTE